MFDISETKRRIRSCHVPNVMNRIKSIFRPESKVVAPTGTSYSSASSSSAASARTIDDSPPVNHNFPDAIDLPSSSTTTPAMSVDTGSIGASTASPNITPAPSPRLPKSPLTPPPTPKDLCIPGTFSYEESLPALVTSPSPSDLDDAVPVVEPAPEPPSEPNPLNTLELFQKCSTMLHKNLDGMKVLHGRIEDRLKLQSEVANLKREVARLKEMNATAKEELRVWHEIISQQETMPIEPVD